MSPHQLSVARTLVPSHSLVDAEPERAHYWRALLAKWKVRGKRADSATFFPGANPVSIARANLPALEEHPHVIALKSDGVRYALFLTLRPGSTREQPQPVALMIDRARNMYEVEVLAPEAYFCEGTILEGELVWHLPDNRSHLFLVFDAVCIRGESLLDKPFEERLRAAHQCTRLSEELSKCSPDDMEHRVFEADGIALVHFEPHIVMRPKRFVGREHAVRLWSERSEAEHRVDGLIVHRADAAYVHGTATGVAYKWKPEHSVDLAGPPTSLRAADGPLGAHIGGRRVEVLPSRVECIRADDVAEYHVEVVDESHVRLFAMRTRTDKCVPNGLRVISATVQDAVENLEPSDLI